jgi:glucosylceramidase
MKTNNEWTGLGFIRDEFYQTWADYHLKWLHLMREEGINFWAITTGNEPLNGAVFTGYVKFISLGWFPPSQGKWVAKNLGPTLRNSTLADVKILAGDDQRFIFPWWFREMYEAHPESRNFIDGHAVHWYWNKLASPNVLDRSREWFPEKLLIASEASVGEKIWDERRPVPGLWMRCQHYILEIIEDLNHYVNAWLDWNMALDELGGPNYVNNFVDSAIIINTTSEFIKSS